MRGVVVTPLGDAQADDVGARVHVLRVDLALRIEASDRPAEGRARLHRGERKLDPFGW
jgi:hypothetical protein